MQRLAYDDWDEHRREIEQFSDEAYEADLVAEHVIVDARTVAQLAAIDGHAGED